jgi:hypothetical protein
MLCTPQGRFLGKAQAPIREVGVQWTGSYYSGASRGMVASPPMIARDHAMQHAQPPGIEYDDPASYHEQYVTNPNQPGPYSYGGPREMDG